MLNNILIENFKSIENQSLILKPLTILTGLNSTGKSSIIQSILLICKYYSKTNKDVLSSLVAHFSDFVDVRNKYTNAKIIKIRLDDYFIEFDYDGFHINTIEDKNINYEENIYFLSANRLGQEELASLNKEQKIGINGEYIFGYFESHKDDKLQDNIIKFTESGRTLKAQVNSWLQYILDLNISLQTEKITSNNVKVSFISDEISSINPFNLGAGNSYLVKVLIVTLMCNPNGVVLIENPEIHLHPRAQAKLGDFFSWIAQAGIQIIIETHSEHLINKVKYQVYKRVLDSENLAIYYKKNIRDKFINLGVNKNGKFINDEGEAAFFPSGFFDSTLQELLEIG